MNQVLRELLGDGVADQDNWASELRTERLSECERVGRAERHAAPRLRLTGWVRAQVDLRPRPEADAHAADARLGARRALARV